MITSSAWGVLVASHSQHTARVGEVLTSMSIDHYIPLEEKIHITNGRRVETVRPILGEYILTSITNIWHQMLRIRGVSGMLLNESGFPAIVIPRELEAIRELFGDGIYRRSESPQGFMYGDRVTPKEGPFAQRIGRYDGKTHRGEAALFVLFGREQRLVFKRGTLVSAGGGEVNPDKKRNSGRWSKTVA